MKHIIEKHVKTVGIPAAPTHVVVQTNAIPIDSFPALISDLEAEISNAMEWALNNARQSQTKGLFYLSDDVFGREPLSTAELLKIYQNQEK